MFDAARLPAGGGSAQPAKEPKPDAAPAKAEPAKPEPAPAKRRLRPPNGQEGPLKITVDLDGVFEARSASEIVVRLDEYVPAPALVVVGAVKHGARVKKGDVLVTFDTEKLDKTIDDLRTDLKLSELGLQASRRQLGDPGEDHADGPGGERAGREDQRGRPEVLLRRAASLQSEDGRVQSEVGQATRWSTRRRNCGSWKRCTRPTT